MVRVDHEHRLLHLHKEAIEPQIMYLPADVLSAGQIHLFGLVNSFVDTRFAEGRRFLCICSYEANFGYCKHSCITQALRNDLRCPMCRRFAHPMDITPDS